ncbi:MAG: hypothetical protein ABTD50_14830 [Polyangiaceae bacterium]
MEPLPANGTAELAFDRLLSPVCISRQTFSLHDVDGYYLTPVVGYDPVARIVSLTSLWPLDPNHVYEVDALAPSGPTDVNGVRSIDGATLAQSPLGIAFSIGPSDPGPLLPSAPVMDFCRDINPIFTNKCAMSGCHGSSLPAAGLRLDSPQGIALTAIGLVAHGADTGPTASALPPVVTFGTNMPLIDPGAGSPAAGNPANSWLLYKLLLAPPAPISSTPYASDCDGGVLVAPSTAQAHVTSWQPLSASERDALEAVMSGQAMPPPSTAADGTENTPLSEDELERVSLWIAQGAAMQATCACQ